MEEGKSAMSELEFKLGFAALADLIPEIVGEPLEDEHHSAESGDGLQKTSTGLMVWRKADNWTAFTDGHQTWINGPNGLEVRLNSERLPWEMDYQADLPSPLIEVWDSPNCWRGRPFGDPIAIVIHTMAGSEAGAESWLNNPASQASAHFGANLDGDIDNYVPLSDRAWANGRLEAGHRWFEMYDGKRDGFRENPNNHTVSIETEDKGDPACPVTDVLYLATHAACRLVLARYSSIRFLTSHHVISPLSRPHCCGERWTASGRFVQLAKELRLVPII